MKFIVDNVIISEGDGLPTIRKKTAERLGAHAQGLRVEVIKRRWIRSEIGGAVCLSVIAETNEFLRSTSSFARFEEPVIDTEPLVWKCRPVVVGFGLSGIIAALYLAKRGLRPIVLERGPALDNRPLVPTKKNPLTRDGEGSILAQIGSLFCLDDFDPRLKALLEAEGIAFPGPEAHRFLEPAKVRSILTTLHQKIVSYGGEILFNANYLGTKTRFGKIKGVVYKSGGAESFIKTNKVLLACGACDDMFYIGTGLPALPRTFNECVYGKKTIDDKHPLYIAQSTLKIQSARAILITGLCGARVVDIGSTAGMCIQAYNFDGKGRHVQSLLGVEISREEGEKICKNTYDASKPTHVPCSSVADFYAKRTPLRLGSIKPEKIADIRLDNYSKILGVGPAKRLAAAFTQFAKTHPYLDSKDAIFEGLFLLAGCESDEPKNLNGVWASCVPVSKCMDFAAKATAGFKAALRLCE